MEDFTALEKLAITQLNLTPDVMENESLDNVNNIITRLSMLFPELHIVSLTSLYKSIKDKMFVIPDENPFYIDDAAAIALSTYYSREVIEKMTNQQIIDSLQASDIYHRLFNHFTELDALRARINALDILDGRLGYDLTGTRLILQN